MPNRSSSLPRRYALRWRLPFFASLLIATVLATFLWAAYRRVEATLVGAAGARAQTAADQVAGLLDARRSVEELRRLATDTSVNGSSMLPLGVQVSEILSYRSGL